MLIDHCQAGDSLLERDQLIRLSSHYSQSDYAYYLVALSKSLSICENIKFSAVDQREDAIYRTALACAWPRKIA